MAFVSYFCSGICVLCHNGNHSWVPVRVYTLYSICHYPWLTILIRVKVHATRFGVYVPDMCMCPCKLSCTTTLHQSFVHIHACTRVKWKMCCVSFCCTHAWSSLYWAVSYVCCVSTLKTLIATYLCEMNLYNYCRAAQLTFEDIKFWRFRGFLENFKNIYPQNHKIV